MNRTTTARVPEEFPDPSWPEGPQAPTGAPNVIVVLTDDVGYGASSTFGGPIATPTLDSLASAGLRYTRFHTTAMCSPTRAALLTGRQHHSVGFGRLTETAMAYDGYTSVLPASAATIARILHENGYVTAHLGKHHNTPDWENGPAGPFDRWPTGLGFDHWYGFHGGGCNNWVPPLFSDTQAVEPPSDPDYHLEKDLADHAIRWVRRQKSAAPDRPFFLYYATAGGHAPHHAPQDWVERFRGQFDQGWDAVREETLARQVSSGVVAANTVLTERPDEVPAWDSLTDDQRRLYARQMEVFAASVAHSDAQIGRLLETLRDLGELDNTLVVFVQGDNGASAEGGPDGALNEGLYMNGMADDVGRMLEHLDELGGPLHYNHYPVGWAHAMDTPFQWFKQVASHFGGTRNGMVVSWPDGIEARGEVRNQFHHIVDVAPTILDLIGVRFPETVDGVEQQPVDGTSMRYSFKDADAPSTRRTQYFELHGNRALYHDGWIASCGPVEMPWAFRYPPPEPDEIPWQLYNVEEDWSQAVDLAGEHPEKLRDLQDRFWMEATAHGVLPLSVGLARRAGPAQPSAVRGRSSFVYYEGATRIPPGSSPELVNTSWRITADVELDERAEGVLFAQGGRFGGHALVLHAGLLTYHHNVLGVHRDTVKATAPAPAGRHLLEARFERAGEEVGAGGALQLLVDGEQVASAVLTQTVRWRMSYVEGLNVGADTGTPVSEEYVVPFGFTGRLHSVKVELT
jgi:arylsulfatase